MKQTSKRLVAALLAGLLALSLTACGGGGGASSKEVVLYDGNYSEMQLIHQMVKLLVEKNTDLTVTIKDEMSNVNAFRELTADPPASDLVNSYDGTLLTTFLKQDPADVPEGKSLYEYTNEQAMKEYNIRMLDLLGTDNTYAIAVPETIAAQYKLEKVSDLIPVAGELVFGAEHEFFTEEGSMKYGPFVKFYGLNFKDKVSVDIGLKYAAIENASFQVTEVYATDGLNRKAGLKILEDDLHFFPEYNGALLVRDDLFARVAETAPNLEEVLNQLGGIFTNEIMTDLTYAVDVEGRPVAEVATEFLQKQGLL
ncbi:MAG: glycine betaine ABC transporter substrate-binding protein [Oscillospiraceae bacterium]